MQGRVGSRVGCLLLGVPASGWGRLTFCPPSARIPKAGKHVRHSAICRFQASRSLIQAQMLDRPSAPTMQGGGGGHASLTAVPACWGPGTYMRAGPDARRPELACRLAWWVLVAVPCMRGGWWAQRAGAAARGVLAPFGQDCAGWPGGGGGGGACHPPAVSKLRGPHTGGPL
jgi:hypothetical protein